MIKDYKGDRATQKDGLISYFFDFTELDDVINAVISEREKKINDYGLENYKKYIERNSKNQLFKRFEKMEGETKNGKYNKNVKSVSK